MSRLYKYFIITTLMWLISVMEGLAQNSYNYSRGLEALQNKNDEEALEYFYKEVEDNEKNADAYFFIALLQYYKEDYGRALSAADKAVKFASKKDKEGKSDALTMRAEIYRALGQNGYALTDLNNAIKEDPENEDAYEDRADLYYDMEMYSPAAADYRKLIQLDPGNTAGYMGLGLVMNSEGRYSEGVTQFDYVIKLDQDDPYGWAHRAESYIGLKQWTKAADDVTQSLSLKDTRLAGYYMYQLADSSLADITAKLKIQEAKNPNSAYWPYLSGAVYQYVGQHSMAMEKYKKSHANEPYPATATRISECYEELGDYDMALEYIDQAFALDSTYTYSIFMKSTLLDEAGRTDEAIAVMDKYISLYPEYYGGYYKRGWMEDHTGRIDDAIEDYSVAISLDPEYCYTYLNRGILYRLQGKSELARSDFEQVVRLDTVPGDNNAAMYAYHYLGQKDKAIDFMDEALKVDGNGNYYDAACLYSIMGDKAKALSYLRKALEAGYRNFAHIARDRDLDNIRGDRSFKIMIDEYRRKHESEVERPAAEAGSYEEAYAEIPFTKEGGVCKVKCSINGLPLHFIFDTGASDVTISNVEATFMAKNGYLKSSDILGSQYYMTADGEISEGTVIILRQVKFGGLQLDDVRASVVKSQSAPLLLGQSVLARLGKIEIDNADRVIKVTYKRRVTQ